MTPLLLDTSVVNRLSELVVSDAVEDEIASGDAVLCAPVVYEVCFSARNPKHLAELRGALGAFPQVPIHQADFDRALDVQSELCRRGSHRAVSMADLLIAAAAEARGCIVVHYDADFERIASVTGQPVRWVVPRGSVA